jgi:hypothetical protein
MESGVEDRRGRAILPSGPRGTTGLVLVVAALFLVASVAHGGVWDPHELRRAELARRIAIHLFGAHDLVVDPVRDVMPTLTDLGSGELPFTSMSVGFAIWGLHDWAGRLPLALWGVAGVIAMYAFLARFISPRAGLYAAITLCTMPLYFLQARVMFGDIVTMAAFAFAFFGGLGVVIERAPRFRIGWAGLALAGLVAGYLSRGLFFGMATPCVAIAVGALVVRGAGKAPTDRVGDAWVGLMAIVAVVALWRGSRLVLDVGWRQVEVPRALGFAIQAAPPPEATFELTLRDLGHALFPWSAFVPLALGRLAWLPSIRGDARWRSITIRVGLIVALAAAYLTHDALAPFTGSLPFVATAVVAAVVGIAVADLELGAPSSGLVGAGTVALGLVLLADLRRLPAKVLAPFYLPVEAASSTAASVDRRWLYGATAAFLGLVWLTWLDPRSVLSGRPGRESLGMEVGPATKRWLVARIEVYEAAARRLATTWHGNLAFGFLLVEAALVGVAGMLVAGRHFGWASVVGLPHPLAWAGLNLWWIAPLAIVGSPVLLDVLRGAFAATMGWLRLPRAFGMALAAFVGGGVLCFGFYGALARRLSPKAVYGEYAARHAANEPLAVLGLGVTSARYYAEGAPTREMSGTRHATRWLLEGRAVASTSRRWLVFRAEELPEMNALFRQTTGVNLPILGTTDGESLLASSALGAEANANPLEPFVLNAPPEMIQHPVDASFDGRVETIGWELHDERGRLASYATAGRRYRLTVYHRVIAALNRRYRAFVHIDGEGRRHNGDHEPVAGHYGTHLWRAGDVIADPYELVLEPNFTAGDYRLYYGFYIGRQRLEVTRGVARDDRLDAGRLLVR